MRQEVWVPDVFHAVDFDKLPVPVQELCNGVPIYTMIPREDDDDDSYNDDDKDVTNETEMSEPATTVTYVDTENENDYGDDNAEYSDKNEENPPYYGLPPPTLYDDDNNNEYDEYYYDEMEQEYATTSPETQTEMGDDSWLYRQKRQVSDIHNICCIFQKKIKS